MATFDDAYYKNLYKLKKEDGKLNVKIKTSENIRELFSEILRLLIELEIK